MTYNELIDIAFAAMQKKNPNFKGFSQETASAMAAAFTVLAIVGKNTLDELAFIDANANVVSLPVPETGNKTEKVNEKAQKTKSNGVKTNDGDSFAE